MATLLALKNNITTTEKEVNVSTEKEKEFQQVRQWYSSLAEKHTNLQKEHQALQEEHVKLQEKYMSLKQASNLNESFVADYSGTKDKKKKTKKDKKEKASLGDVVWQRAGKMQVPERAGAQKSGWVKHGSFRRPSFTNIPFFTLPRPRVQQNQEFSDPSTA